MRPLLLAGASLLALLAAAPTASAATKTFVYIDGVVEYTVPASGEYEIAAYGAQGGSTKNNSGNGATGGKGALVSSHFNLTAGEVLQIAVGGVGGGGKYSGGGGGGAFVIGPDNLPLLIAGGGGGAGGGVNTYSSGYGGLISNDGGDGFGQQIHRGLGGAAAMGLPVEAMAAAAAEEASPAPGAPEPKATAAGLGASSNSAAESGITAITLALRATADLAAEAVGEPAIRPAIRTRRAHSALEAGAAAAVIAAAAEAKAPISCPGLIMAVVAAEVARSPAGSARTSRRAFNLETGR